VARVAWLEPGTIMRVLDGGASAVICPMISTPDDAERFVRACRYPPEGYRSYGSPTVRTDDAGAGPAPLGERVATIAMLETAEALRRMDEIMRTPGLDAVYVGPADLGLSLGHRPSLGDPHANVIEGLLAVAKAAAKRGLPAGVHCGSISFAERMMDAGYRFVTVLSDNVLLATAGAATVATVRTRISAAALPADGATAAPKSS
jgi:4-hydroxy-2-oxoheptanedioate aldolase